MVYNDSFRNPFLPITFPVIRPITDPGVGGGGGGEAPIFFESMVNGFKQDADVACVRFPQPLPLTETTGLVFFAQKNVNFVGGAENGQRLCVRDYSIDFDSKLIAYSATRVIEQPPLWSSGKGWCTEPFAHILRGGPNAGRIVLMNNRDDSVNQIPAERILNLYSRYSDDDGVTWSNPTLCVANDGNYLSSTGQLLELPSGRLVYPVWRLSDRGHGAIYSDDYGATWSRSSTFATDNSESWTEPCLFRAADGTLVSYCRSDSVDSELERGVFTSADDGVTWAYVGSNAAAALKNSNTACLNDDGYLLLGSTANPVYYNRVKFRVLASTDMGATFPVSWGPFNDKLGAGYAQISKLRENTYILGYETFNGQSNVNPDGDINTENNALLAVFNRAELAAAPEVRPAPTDSAATIYAAYASRVAADGGTVTSPTACQAAIQSAIDGGYWLDSAIAISANWGVKLSGSNITKLYDLIGANDCTPTGVVTIDTASFAWAAMNFAAPDRYILTPSIAIDDGNHNPYAQASSGAGSFGNIFLTSIEGVGSAYPLYVRHHNAGEVLAAPFNVWDVNGNAYPAYNSLAPAVGSSRCVLVETKANRVTMWDSGVHHQIKVAGGQLPNGINRKILINGIINTGGSRNVESTGKFNELWHLRYANRHTAAQLSADQGARYT